jgi:BMFP domain-containing protein YqiC
MTRFPSLELTCDSIRKSGNCDSGYSCAYSYNLAWRSPTQPLTPEANPRLVFERLFGAGSQAERIENLKRRQAEQHSILDFVMQDAADVQRKLNGRDRQKLDQYLTSVREIEQRIEQAERMPVANPGTEAPAGIPQGFDEHIALLCDMMVLAFQTDSTRVATLMLAGEGSNRTFSDLGFSEGHHNLTHHENRAEMIDKVKEIDLWYVKQLAKFLEKLETTKDVDGNSLLRNSMIVYGSGNADGNRHSHNNLPILLAGGGGGTLKPGRYVKVKASPLSNLFLTMADCLGVRIPKHGDSTGRLEVVT